MECWSDGFRISGKPNTPVLQHSITPISVEDLNEFSVCRGDG